MRGRSLTARLIVTLAATQTLAVVVAWFIIAVLSSIGAIGALGYSSADYFSYYRVRDLISQSIVTRADASLAIEPNDALRAELARTPRLKYAVFRSMNEPAIDGSSPQLAALMATAAVQIIGMDFAVADRGTRPTRGSLWQWATPVGPMFIVASGSAYHWSDPFYAFRNELFSQGLYFLVIFIGSASVALIVVSRAMEPLRRAADAVERIDMESLDQRLGADDAPREIKPFVEAINRALARLDASVARMRRYTANAAHELRTPVAILRARLENPEEVDFRTDLKRDARRIQAIVEQMLIAARLTERQAALDQEINLVKTARSIVADYTPLIFKAGRQIEFDCGDIRRPVRGSQQAIECVLANLIDNALRAEPHGGAIFVRVPSEGVVEVIDHGEGVAPDDRERIFEPFWRKSDATPGTGLGLAISKELIVKLHGRICVEETPGGGATFRVSFDAADERA